MFHINQHYSRVPKFELEVVMPKELSTRDSKLWFMRKFISQISPQQQMSVWPTEANRVEIIFCHIFCLGHPWHMLYLKNPWFLCVRKYWHFLGGKEKKDYKIDGRIFNHEIWTLINWCFYSLKTFLIKVYESFYKVL